MISKFLSLRLIILALLSGQLLASSYNSVRTARISEDAVETVSLVLGKSSVLRFDSKPKNVVIGNSNFFNVEFNGSDVTIQPLAVGETNLFIYLKDQTFLFDLKAVYQAQDPTFRNDDLVIVRYRDPKASYYRPPIVRLKKLNRKIMNERLKLEFSSIYRLESLKKLLLEFKAPKETFISVEKKELKSMPSIARLGKRLRVVLPMNASFPRKIKFQVGKKTIETTIRREDVVF